MTSGRQPARLAHDRETAGEIRPLERHAEEEAQSRDRAVDARRADTGLGLMQLETAHLLGGRRVGRAADEGRERADVANVSLRVFSLKPRTVMSSIMRPRSALTGEHEGWVSSGRSSRAEGCRTFDARERMPRSSRPNVQALTDATDNATTSKLAPLPRERVRSVAAAFVGRNVGQLFHD
jgi:hypothetical protein